KWLDEPNFMLNNLLMKVAVILVPLIDLALVYFIFIKTENLLYAMAGLVPAALIIRQYVQRINVHHLQVEASEKVLDKYNALVETIESLDVKNEYLKEYQAVFHLDNKLASKRLKRLAYLIKQLNVRSNPFALLFNIFGLWDFHWILKLENWRHANGKYLKKWFESIAQFELISRGFTGLMGFRSNS
ncbi:MAG: hypothetical protein AAGK97_19120, partial [Bacteroidota bacterium]